MYRKGFGDRFLLTFTENGKRYHMLIDCGVLKGTPDAGQLMQEIVDDIRKETDGVLDLLVITHEHWDHISSFHQVPDAWDEITVKQVWMAWTEDPKDDIARGLRQNREAARQQLQSLILQPQLAADGALANLLFPDELEQDMATTRQVMLDVMGKSQSPVEFHRAGTLASLNGVEGVRIYVLGPPAGLELFKDQPSAGHSEIYQNTQALNLADTIWAGVVQRAASVAQPAAPDPGTAETRALPFEKGYMIEQQAARTDHFFQTRYFESQPCKPIGWRRIDDDWLSTSSALGLALGSDTNNTSLALAIELTASDQVLLFPGDAQVGNWLSWHSYTWTPDQANGQKREVKAADLLNRTIFYKVGHHGSENATLSTLGLELMGKRGLVAMIPVDEEVAQRQGRKRPDGTHTGWKMPYGILLAALKAKTGGRVIRADTGVPQDDAKAPNLADDDWQQFKRAVSCDPAGLYIDYTIAG
jgi:beta-lactamase superfamily II metal-dependent hydrolase